MILHHGSPPRRAAFAFPGVTEYADSSLARRVPPATAGRVTFPAPQQERHTISSRIFVGNLSYETSSTELETLFGQVGQVTEVFLPVDRATDKPRGFAFVEFGDAASVSQAIEKLDGTELNGRNLRVSEARDRAPRPPMGPPPFMDDGPPSMDFGRRPAKPKGSRRGLRGRKRGF